MDLKTARKLNQLNKDFYQSVATEFSETRTGFWPGWQRASTYFPPKNSPLKVLDIGCGNGRFSQYLLHNNFEFEYLGLDFNDELLSIARKKCSQVGCVNFLELDLFEALTTATLANQIATSYDVIVAFGVWHHLPSKQVREQLLKQAQKLLSADGVFIVTLWQFDTLPNLFENRVAATQLNIELEKNDYLLTWQGDKNILRYCHLTKPTEFLEYLKKTQLKVIDSFSADKANYYFVLSPGKMET